MEKNPLQNQQGQNTSSLEGQEGGSRVMTPPAFALTNNAATQRGPQGPAQLQAAAGAQPTMMERVSNFFTGIGDWFRNMMGGGGTQPAANPGAQTPVQNPAQTAGPVAAGPQNTTATPAPTPAAVNVTRSVGLGGANVPSDVRQVQDRLQTLGYLSTTDFTAEQANAAGTVPIADAAMPRTIVAISRYMMGAFGRPGMLIEPNQASNSFMNNAMATALGNVGVGGDVGRNAQNNAADVRAVQLRLNALGKLTGPTYTTELVAANATGRIADTVLASTIAAINSFNITVAGNSLFIIRAGSREQELLNNPPRYTAGNLSITNSVGTGGSNAAADVTSVQARLVQLGFLTDAARTAEAPAAGATAPVAVANLRQTIAAINQFQTAMALTGNGLVKPGDETHRQMINPMLPEKTSIALTGSVGRGGANNRADVRLIQDRLQAIGLLSTAGYLAERAPTGAGNVAITAIPLTQAALEKFNATAGGSTSGLIGPDSKELRMLNDPTQGTTTNFNQESNNVLAGYDYQSPSAAVNRVINAIEAVESGDRSGEVPADLVNGAGTAASFGKAQVIGGTALGTIGGNRGMQEFYGITNQMLADMRNRAAAAETHYNAIYTEVPAAGLDANAITTRATAYTTANGATFIRETSLGQDDILRMYHTANIRRLILADPIARGDDNQVSAPTRAARNALVTQHVTALLANPRFSNSSTYLGMNTSSLNAYFRDTDNLGENRAAFKTKAIFSGSGGQQVRNAMTDNRGTAIGRTFIEQTYNSARGAVAATTPNRDRAIAGVTAIMHNRGGSASSWAGNLTAVYGDNYVVGMLRHWDNP
jgi:hypothetical protein